MAKTIVRYSKSIVVIHWVSAIAVLGAWLSAEGGRKSCKTRPSCISRSDLRFWFWFCHA